jgi:chemotaxis protein MotB
MAKYKRRRRRTDTSVDDWLMTYADMITLLLCFFAIFLSISVPKEDQMKTARQRVLEQFASAEALQNVKDIVIVGSAMQNEDAYDSLPSIVGMNHQGEGQDKTGDQLGSGRYQEEEGGRHKPAPEGDRIKVIEMPSAAFFTSGSATLSGDGQNLLQGIIDKDLKAENLQGFQVTVEGHTDDVPIKTAQFPSNWELSTARAAAVVRFFIERGVDPSRLQASGYADVFPKVPNRDELGNPIAENRAQNRRVIIKLEKIEKAE